MPHILVGAVSTGFAFARPARNFQLGATGSQAPVLQGTFAKNCLFRQSDPDFSSDDQRLSGEFPTLVNREFLREIRDLSFGISELLPEIREVPIPLNSRTPGLPVQHSNHAGCAHLTSHSDC